MPSKKWQLIGPDAAKMADAGRWLVSWLVGSVGRAAHDIAIAIGNYKETMRDNGRYNLFIGSISIFARTVALQRSPSHRRVKPFITEDLNDSFHVNRPDDT